MSADRRGRIHGRDYLDSLEEDELEVLVVEALVADHLLQESDQLNRVVLVRLR